MFDMSPHWRCRVCRAIIDGQVGLSSHSTHYGSMDPQRCLFGSASYSSTIQLHAPLGDVSSLFRSVFGLPFMGPATSVPSTQSMLLAIR